MFFKKHAKELKIDTNKIFTLGNSSGAVIALNNAFGNFKGRAKATISLWGAVIDTSFLVEKNIPIMLVHGKNDEIIPYDKGQVSISALFRKAGVFFFLNMKIFLPHITSNFIHPYFSEVLQYIKFWIEKK